MAEPQPQPSPPAQARLIHFNACPLPLRERLVALLNRPDLPPLSKRTPPSAGCLVLAVGGALLFLALAGFELVVDVGKTPFYSPVRLALTLIAFLTALCGPALAVRSWYLGRAPYPLASVFCPRTRIEVQPHDPGLLRVCPVGGAFSFEVQTKRYVDAKTKVLLYTEDRLLFAEPDGKTRSQLVAATRSRAKAIDEPLARLGELRKAFDEAVRRGDLETVRAEDPFFAAQLEGQAAGLTKEPPATPPAEGPRVEYPPPPLYVRACAPLGGCAVLGALLVTGVAGLVSDHAFYRDAREHESPGQYHNYLKYGILHRGTVREELLPAAAYREAARDSYPSLRRGEPPQPRTRQSRIESLERFLAEYPSSPQAAEARALLDQLRAGR